MITLSVSGPETGKAYREGLFDRDVAGGGVEKVDSNYEVRSESGEAAEFTLQVLSPCWVHDGSYKTYSDGISVG